ncbi:MAG: lysine exporter LysO family protein [Oscillospiraceae bacterium]|nr:lysine exporter LysO family protein [Oscillospiraceae bacterium]
MSTTAGTLLHMGIYVVLMVVGALIGARAIGQKREAKWLGRLQTLALMVMILSLGVSLGGNDRVIASLGQIGLAAAVITVFAMTGSVLAVTALRRFVLHLDRYARPMGAAEENDPSPAGGGKADNAMTWWIVAAVAVGMALGRFVLPAAALDVCGTVIDVGLYVLLFLVGMDMGRQGTILQEIKAAGWRVLLLPAAVAAGTLAFAAAAGLLLPMTVKDAMASASGMGWYSLATTLLAPYSLEISAVAFLSNVMREVLAILFVPVVAKHVGYLECVAMPGAAAMDTVLPVVVGATHQRLTLYSFTSGVVLSLLVPVLVPLIVAL